MKKRIEIEKLLRWAVQEEMPKGKPLNLDLGQILARKFVPTPFCLTRRPASLTNGDLGPYDVVPGEPHKDAQKVADLIQGLPINYKIAETAHSDLLAAIGAVSGSNSKKKLTEPLNQRALVSIHAMKGTRPHWDLGHPRPKGLSVLLPDEKGALRPRPVVHGVEDDGSLFKLSPKDGRAARLRVSDFKFLPRSKLEWEDPSPLKILEARADYFAWHSALVEMAALLSSSGALSDIEVTEPISVPLPWITGQARPSRILRAISRIETSKQIIPVVVRGPARSTVYHFEIPRDHINAIEWLATAIMDSVLAADQTHLMGKVSLATRYRAALIAG